MKGMPGSSNPKGKLGSSNPKGKLVSSDLKHKLGRLTSKAVCETFHVLAEEQSLTCSR
jgi:hypothetical protein